MAEVLTDVPASVLAIYAHPDDPEVGCGGTLAAWSAAGCDVHVVVCTSGDKGAAADAISAEEQVGARALEVAAAAEALGASGHTLLGIPDGEVEDTVDLRRRLVALVRERRPEVVIGHDPTAAFFGQSYVNHRDHRVLGWAVLDALHPAASSARYFPDAGEPHTVRTCLLSGTLEPDVWVDIDATLEAKVTAIACHGSQLGSATTAADLVEIVALRAEQAGAAAGLAHAECFRRIST